MQGNPAKNAGAVKPGGNFAETLEPGANKRGCLGVRLERVIACSAVAAERGLKRPAAVAGIPRCTSRML